MSTNNSAVQMYALGLDQVANAIKHTGTKRTMLVQGDMGTGKSSLLTTLATELPNHIRVLLRLYHQGLG